VKFFDLQVAIGGLLLDLAGENADQPFQSLLFSLSYKIRMNVKPDGQVSQCFFPFQGLFGYLGLEFRRVTISLALRHDPSVCLGFTLYTCPSFGDHLSLSSATLQISA
jgi:hypothetical protein